MDCKDLTVCDFVKHDGTIKIVDAVYLCSVSVHGVALSKLVHVDDIEPIPLTEEILVKNGFIFNKGYAVLQVSEDTYLDFYKHEHRLRKVWEGIDEWNNHAKIRDVTFVCQCYYVHEFQHALRLCGIEKEIEL